MQLLASFYQLLLGAEFMELGRCGFMVSDSDSLHNDWTTNFDGLPGTWLQELN